MSIFLYLGMSVMKSQIISLPENKLIFLHFISVVCEQFYKIIKKNSPPKEGSIGCYIIIRIYLDFFMLSSSMTLQI